MAVTVRQRDDPSGLTITTSGQPAQHVAFDATGIDQVEFLVATNVGEAPKPVAKIASGGETSRIMLAVKAALAAADPTGTLVFDEVDVGVGGRGGQVIGEKLYELAAHHQVICITHLPQVAAFASQHLRIRKVVADNRTTTVVDELSGHERVIETAQMLGGVHITPATLKATTDLLDRAQDWQKQHVRAG
jgi:DNA repair protein RecN (Recombination protein N)